MPVPTAAEKTDRPGAATSGLRLPSLAGHWSPYRYTRAAIRQDTNGAEPGQTLDKAGNKPYRADGYVYFQLNLFKTDTTNESLCGPTPYFLKQGVESFTYLS